MTEAQIQIVKSTVPVLQQYGETITRTFYQNMFEENPQLKDIFNTANQAKGDQPRSLAASVLAYAANIDQLQNLGPAVSLIAHKHCSLDVLPEHYPIVGRNLIRAIGEVLGDAVTPEIADAWTAAYNQLADLLIQVEGDKYRENEARGWSGFKPFRVTAKKGESTVITSFTLVPEDGVPLPEHTAGQYLSVKVADQFENVELRQYTISSAPNPTHYRISVKREEGGLVSNHLHDNVEVGDTVLVHMPHGDFVLEDPNGQPIAFLTAGVGITPAIAMLNRLAESKDSNQIISLVHCAQGREVCAFTSELADLRQRLPGLSVTLVLETACEPTEAAGLDVVAGLLSAEEVATKIPSDAICYLCGPIPFMRVANALLAEAGFGPERRKYEVFGPTLGAAV